MFAGCGNQASTAAAARLRARPERSATTPKSGVHALRLRVGRDAVLYVPESLPEDAGAPLLVYLHGATGDEQEGIRRMSVYADEFKVLLLSPASEDGTWDAIRASYGPDVRFLDRVLDRIFRMCNIDNRRIGICGFSDGASYALGVGMSNGDLFSAVMAFSPGFVPPGAQRTGTPRIFISHGTADRILPIDRCSRVLVPQLKAAGYRVEYREFDGPHTLPRDIGNAAMSWFAG